MIDREQHSSVRRIGLRAAFLVLPLVGIALVAPRAVTWLRQRGDAGPPAGGGFGRPATAEELAAAEKAERRLARVEKAWGGRETIVPGEAVPDASGERVRWFQGFGISVESRPSGAEVRVNGGVVGQTPLTSSIDCLPGEPVEVEVRKAPAPAQRRTVACRKDQLVELVVELR